MLGYIAFRIPNTLKKFVRIGITYFKHNLFKSHVLIAEQIICFSEKDEIKLTV